MEKYLHVVLDGCVIGRLSEESFNYNDVITISGEFYRIDSFDQKSQELSVKRIRAIVAEEQEEEYQVIQEGHSIYSVGVINKSDAQVGNVIQASGSTFVIKSVFSKVRRVVAARAKVVKIK